MFIILHSIEDRETILVNINAIQRVQPLSNGSMVVTSNGGFAVIEKIEEVLASITMRGGRNG